jgi:hypothetical protein
MLWTRDVPAGGAPNEGRPSGLRFLLVLACVPSDPPQHAPGRWSASVPVVTLNLRDATSPPSAAAAWAARQ